MLSNLEQALINTVNQNLEPTYKNVLSVYIEIPGVASGFSDHDPAVYFHRSLDKYADADDKLDSPYAKYIRKIRAQYWGIVVDLTEMILGADSPFPCPCKCGIWDDGKGIRRKLGIIVDEPEAVHAKSEQRPTSKSEEVRARKTMKHPRRTKKRRSRKIASIEVVGPSTYATSKKSKR